MLMKESRIIAFVGMPGSGKSTCADFFKGKGLDEIYFGGIVIDTVKERGLKVNEKNERTVREELRQKEGMAVMAIRSLPKINTSLKKQSVVIDDMYSFDEYKLLRKTYGHRLMVIAVVAPLRVRQDRLVNRPERPLTPDEVCSRDFAQIENLDIGGSIAIADYYLLNDGTTLELTKKLNILHEKIG